MTKYTKDTLWLKPFVEEVQKYNLVPFDKLKAIKGYKVPLNKVEDGWGQTTTYSDGTSVISLLTKSHTRKSIKYPKVHKNIRYEMILSTLAHELSHLKHWKHTPDHFRLQVQMLLLFVPIMNKLGIQDHSKRIKI